MSIPERQSVLAADFPGLDAADAGSMAEQEPIARLAWRLQRQTAMLSMLARLQEGFLVGGPAHSTFEAMLGHLLVLSESEYGFISEVLTDDKGLPFLRMHGLSNVAWSKESNAVHERVSAGGFEFHNLDTLFGSVVRSGAPVISNAPGTDPRSGGLPPGHPPLPAFLGLPLFHGGELVGMVGLANAAKGYEQSLIDELEPMLVICAGMVMALRIEKERNDAQQALRDSEQHFRTLANASSALICACAADMSCDYFNDSWLRFTGRSLEQELGSGWREGVHPDDRLRCKDVFATAFATQQGFTLEYRLRNATGSYCWLLHEGSPRFDREGRFIGYICYSTHICARKRVEVALEALAARFATLSGNAFFEAVSRHLVEALDLDLAFVGELVPNKALLKVRAGWAEGKALPAFEYALNTAPCSGFDSREMCLLADSASRLFPHDRLLSEWGAETYCALPLLAKDGSGLGMMIAIKRERVHDCAALRVLMDVFDDRVSAEIERERAEEGRRLAASVFTHANEGIVITDAHGVVLDVNAAFCRITAYPREAVIGRNLRLLSSEQHDAAFYAAMWRALRAEGQWQGEIWSRRYSGEEFAAWLTVSALRDEDGQIEQFVGLFSDITAQKAHKMQLEYIAHYDALTGLPNRVLLHDRLGQGMAQARRRGGQLAVAYIDLDGFKEVNDGYGHDMGDRLLVELALRMKAGLREGDSMSRLGGDEFVAVLGDLDGESRAVQLVQRLLATLAMPVRCGAEKLQVSASIGLTLYPQLEDVDADQLLRQADLAMYQAKLTGKNRYHLFDIAQDRKLRGRHRSLTRIGRALGAQEFVLHYQPKVNMRSGVVVGVEALIRWQHPHDGLVGPGVFLPVIEHHALAIKLGEWVIDTALCQIEAWQQAGLHLPVSVNIGAHHLQSSIFMDRLRGLLAAHPEVSPSMLELEVLETSALENITHVARIVESCAELGVSFALDDFGTGYCSLAYLKRLPHARLKIDQLFVRDMLIDPEDRAILEAVVGLAKAFRRGVVAEGVETAEQGSALLELGCEVAQGFGIARPMPAEHVPLWLSRWQPPAAWSGAA